MHELITYHIPSPRGRNEPASEVYVYPAYTFLFPLAFQGEKIDARKFYQPSQAKPSQAKPSQAKPSQASL